MSPSNIDVINVPVDTLSAGSHLQFDPELNVPQSEHSPQPHVTKYSNPLEEKQIEKEKKLAIKPVDSSSFAPEDSAPEATGVKGSRDPKKGIHLS